MFNIFVVSFSYAAALVGAGFASGQEIISFFVRYGKASLFGIMLSSLLFGLFAAVILSKSIEFKTDCYSDYLRKLMPRPIERLSEAVTVLYGLSVFCVMSSCCGRMGYMLFGADIRIGIAVMCALCAAVLFTGTDGAINFNAVLGAVITIGTIACCIYLLAYREHQTFSNNTKMTMSALSYSGYNLLTAGAVLVPMSKRIKNKTDAYLTGAVSACIMFSMMLLIWGILSIYYGKINLGEIPMLTMVMRQNTAVTVIYGLLLFAAVLSTAVSSGISTVNIIGTYTGRIPACIITILCGLCFGMTAFSALIDTAYRYCGYVGIFVVIYILIFSVKGRKLKKNKENKRYLSEN